MTRHKIPTIDLFAGPGGLSHGFSSYHGPASFDVRLSIEKDEVAHKTLLLRSFLRHLGSPPKAYYQYIRGEISLETLKRQFVTEWTRAESEAVRWELGKVEFSEVHARIKEALA